MPERPIPPVRLGLMAPLSGLVALYGTEISHAGRIACDEINAAGGVLGQPLELLLEDDGSLPETAVPAAERLLEQGCVALVGNLLSNSRIAVASKVSEPQQVPYLNFSFYEGSIHHRYFFHFAALPNQQIERMIPCMADLAGPKMFFAGSNYEWPRGSIDAGMRAIRALGGEVVGEEYLPIGSAQVDALIDRVQRSGADVFVPYFAGEDQVRLLTAFTRRGLKSHMAVVMGHFDEAMAAHLPPEVREGFYSCNTYFMTLETPANQRYLSALASLPDVNTLHPDGSGVLTNFGEGTYLCVHAFAQAANRAGSLNSAALVEALEQTELEVPQGIVRMDPTTHHAAVNAYLARCDFEGRFEIVERFGQLPPKIPERYRQAAKDALREDASGAPSAFTGRPNERPLLRAAEHATSQILAIADVAVLAASAEGTIIEANRRASELFGYPAHELVGLAVRELVPPPMRGRHAKLMHSFLRSAQSERRMGERAEVYGYRKDGSQFPAEVSISKFRADDDWIMVTTLRDVTERRIAEQELTWRATHDLLTGLPNRALIQERLDNALERSRRQGHGVALLFIDLDGFKLINDTHGHATGDELLKAIAQKLLDHVRPGDSVARLGGDEFVILCEHVDKPATAASLADRLNDLLREPLDLPAQRLFATASIGLALGHGTTHSAAEMLRDADAAMYTAKEQGRDGWRLFSEELHDQARRRLDIANGLRQALERDEFGLRFQPIVHPESQRIDGAELLLRWHPASGEVSPAHFVPIAEMNGSIVPIGKWVFRQACLAEARWRELLGEASSPYISVNLSARQLNDSDIADTFQSILEETGACPTQLVLELTETALMNDVAGNLKQLRKLADLGLRMAVDDFGTGYSSLAQLLRLPVDTLKIDREFVDGLDKRDDSRAIVTAVCGMVRAMKLKAVAEGVETASQLGFLRDLGCDAVQGFHLYRPLTADALTDALANDRPGGRPATSDDLYAALYVSKAAHPMDDAALDALLDKARPSNRAQGITGFLLYREGSFMQLIEGSRPRIRRLLQRIDEDPRHRDIRIVFEGPVDQRLFKDWSMGFHRMQANRSSDDFERWRARTLGFLEMASDGRLCYDLMAAFAH